MSKTPYWGMKGTSHPNAKLDEAKVAALRGEPDNEKLAKLAKEFGIALATAKRYRDGSKQRWKHVGDTWSEQ